MQLFYHPQIDSDVILDEQESQHCVKVLRHKTGDQVRLIDGKGKLFEGSIVSDHPKKCEIGQITVIKSEEIPRGIHVAISPTKNSDRMEWFVEKTTEIGVTEITFISCQRSERSRLNLDRVEKKALSALKQSQRLWLPKINPLTPINDVIQQTDEEIRLIAFVDSEDTNALQNLTDQSKDQMILIGPEGDFTKEELAEAQSNGFQKVSLGESVLRTETAGIVAVTLLALGG